MAQVTFTPTATLTPNCCQLAQTFTGQGAGVTLNSAGPEAIYQNTLYVEDVFNNRIQEFQLSGSPVSMTPAGILPGTFNIPLGLAVGGLNLYVGDYGDNLLWKVNLATNTAATIATAVAPIEGVAVDQGNGDVYASVNPNGSFLGGVQVFSAASTYASPATLTLGNGVTWSPRGLWKTGNTLYVADLSNSQVEAFSVTVNGNGYTFSAPQTVITQLDGPDQMAMDGDLNIYVVETANNDVAEFSSSSSYKTERSCPLGLIPTGVIVDVSGNIYTSVNNGTAGEVIEIASCLSNVLPTPTPYYPGSNPPLEGQCFIYPSPARDHATLSYYMAESGQADLKIWNEKGELAAEIGDRKPAGVQVTPFNSSRLAPGVYFYIVTLSYDSGRVEKLKMGKFAVVR